MSAGYDRDMIPTPEIPAEVEVMPDLDLDEAWERYQPFEPLHFGQDILNPMSDAELDRVVEALGVRAGMRILDVACGHGEMLLRIASRLPVEAHGLDESPWAITRAAQRARTREMRGTIRWWLGHGAEAPLGPFDVVTCIGASWIWHGFSGTVRAVARRVAPGGTVAIGDLRVREGAAVDEGRVIARAEQIEAILAAGLSPTGELVASDASWREYQERILACAEAYAAGTPGHPLRDRRRMAASYRGGVRHGHREGGSER